MYLLSYVLSRNIKLIYLTCVLLLLSATPAIAAGDAKIALVTTLNNQFLLSAAHWSIFKASDLSSAFLTLPRHTGTVTLPAGSYRARVESSAKIREQNFKVEAGVDTRVVIPMD